MQAKAAGGAKIVRGTQRADILPPLATDADGIDVRARMRTTAGDALVLSVSHREAAPRYPILLDPPVEYFPWYQAGDPFGLNDGIWRSFQTPGVNHYVAANTTREDMGLWVQSYPGTYPYNSHGGWAYAVPHSSITSDGSSPNPSKTSAYVTQAGFSPIWHWVYWQQGHWNPFVQLCIVDATNNACLYDYNNPPRSYFSYWGGYPWGPTTVVLDNIQGNQQAEQVAFDHPSDANAYNPSQLWTRLGGVNITMADGENPTVTPSHSMVGGGSLPSGWTNSTGTARVSVAAEDRGLGLKNVSVKLGCDANGQGCSSTPPARGMPPVGSQTGQCVGTKREGICPQTTPSPTPSWDYSLGSIPEGLSYGHPSATDALDKTSPANQGRWGLRIDRSAPVVQAPSGSLANDADKILTTRDYSLTLSATDGSRTSNAAMRSGVEGLEVFVDDETEPRFTAPPQDCTDPAGSCGMTATWQIDGGDLEDLAEGSHTVRIVATDALGHRGERSLPITLRGDPDEAAVTITAGQPGLDGSYRLTVTATDPPVADGYGSGVERLEIYLDEQLLDVIEQQCTTGSCPPLSWSRQMNATQSLLVHRASAVAYDRAGNASLEYLGTSLRPDFEYFGYLDEFTNTKPWWDENFDPLAKRSGANVISFAVNWCAIETTAGQYSWHDEVFARVNAYNHPPPPASPRPPSERIAVVPKILNAPLYLRNADQDHACDPDGDGRGVQAVPPADVAGRDWRQAWSAFISAFVARYGPGGTLDANLAAIEAWNEPNLASFWGAIRQENLVPDHRRFAALVNIAGEASSVPVLVGGLATAERVYKSERPDDNPHVFMRETVRHLDASKADGVGFHLYANKEPITRKANELIQERYTKISAELPATGTGCALRCFDDLDQWITEIGFPSDGTGTRNEAKEFGYATEPKQHQRLRNAWHYFSGKQIVKALIVYHLRDAARSSAEAGWVENEPIENGRFGTVHRKQIEGGKKKWIYCWLEERGVQRSDEANPACEPKRPQRPHGQPGP